MNKKLTLVIAISVIITLLSSFAYVVKAENSDDLKVKKEEIQVKIDEANEEIEGIKIELTDLLKQVNELNSQISEYESQIEELDTNLANMQAEIIQVEEDLKIMEEKYVEQEKSFGERLVALYEMGETKYLDVLLSSNDLSDFISNYYLISEIAQCDNDILENIEQQKLKIEETKKSLEQKKQQLKAEKDNKEKTLTALENTKVIKDNYVSQLSDEEKEVQSTIDKYQAELNSIEAQIRQASLQSIGSEYIGGEFAWPAPGYTTLTSTFGMRYHPILHVYRGHAGIDIGAPTGATVIASNSGTVIQSTYNSSYGNLVMIDHGGGIVTVYAHGSQRLVEVGQQVNKGERIMLVGSTGLSTGPHLHFEVRKNGTCVNPLDYVTR